MTFDLRQESILGIEEAVRTTGILRAETQNAIISIANVGVNDKSGHVTGVTSGLRNFTASCKSCHVILNDYRSFAGLFLSKYN